MESESKFIEIGPGEWDEKEAAGVLPFGKWTIIRDDDAAAVGAPAWWATTLPAETAEREYEKSGGTVSAIYGVDVF